MDWGRGWTMCYRRVLRRWASLLLVLLLPPLFLLLQKISLMRWVALLALVLCERLTGCSAMTREILPTSDFVAGHADDETLAIPHQ